MQQISGIKSPSRKSHDSGWTTHQSDVVPHVSQDVLLRHPECSELLFTLFFESNVGIINGWQSAREQSGTIERRAPLLKYPVASCRRAWGFGAIFNSSSSAADRQNGLEGLDGFPESLIFGERQVVAGCSSVTGWTAGGICKRPVGRFYRYSFFRVLRYFEGGMALDRHELVFEYSPDLSRKGVDIVRSDMPDLLRHAMQRLREAALSLSMKTLGCCQLGAREGRLLSSIKCRLEMCVAFFSREGAIYAN